MDSNANNNNKGRLQNFRFNRNNRTQNVVSKFFITKTLYFCFCSEADEKLNLKTIMENLISINRTIVDQSSQQLDKFSKLNSRLAAIKQMTQGHMSFRSII